MDITTANLEMGMPTVEVALGRMSQVLRTAGATGTHLVKIIHGYGSTGKGGAIRTAVRRELEDRQRQGRIKLYIPGDEFSPFYEKARSAVSRYPQLAKDRDYTRGNPGVTIVIL